MSMVLTTVEHLNQAKAEAMDSEQCAIKTEETAGTGTANEEGATTFTTSGEISIGPVSVSNDNVNDVSMAFSSGEADFGDTGSVTVASGNAHQQARSIDTASLIIIRRVIVPRQSKKVSKVPCTTEIGKGSFEQDLGGHNINMAAVGNNDRRVVSQEVQSRKTSDGHNSDIAEMMFNQESNAVVVRLSDMDNSTAKGVKRKRNAEDASLKSRKKGTTARSKSFEGRCKQLIDFIDEFGYYHVPCKYPVNPSLGNWCRTMRC